MTTKDNTRFADSKSSARKHKLSSNIISNPQPNLLIVHVQTEMCYVTSLEADIAQLPLEPQNATYAEALLKACKTCVKNDGFPF